MPRTIRSVMLGSVLLALGCRCEEPSPDAATPIDSMTSSDLVSVDADVCIPCSQTETTPNCTPSRCESRDGKLCCVSAKSR
jgi:hypothetical protein